MLGFTEVLLLFFLAHDKLKGLLALAAISQTSKNCQSLKIEGHSGCERPRQVGLYRAESLHFFGSFIDSALV